jgi:Protein of unknown function (DUF1353)
MFLIRVRPTLLVALLLLGGGLLLWWWDRDPTDRAFGNFDGDVVTRWSDDGRNMTLERDFAYIDFHGKRWDAPTGSVINGASIPRLFWSVIGGPFEGTFRNAAVIHDAACGAQREPWEDVHRMFYNAMRCSRVGQGKAQTMYWAVYHFGPRWQQTATGTVTEVPEQPPAEIVAKAERYFNKKDFTPEQIEACTVEDIENEVAKWDAAKKSTE